MIIREVVRMILHFHIPEKNALLCFRVIDISTIVLFSLLLLLYDDYLKFQQYLSDDEVVDTVYSDSDTMHFILQ
jgi:hypothetical protein